MATANINAVIGYFGKRSQAERAIGDLKNAGFSSNQLGLATYSGGSVHTEEGASLWDKIVHFFGGKDDYEYDAEQLRGSLEYAGVTRDRAQYFEYQLAHGDHGAIVTVSADGRERDAERILQENSADVGTNAASFRYPAAMGQPASSERRKIQLLGEVLRIHKERVPLGEVRLHKNVVTETQNVQVPTTREELVIERHAGGEEARPGCEMGRESDLRIPLSEEQVRVEKKPTVREEVEVTKRAVEDTRNVSEQVRHEELNVDKDQKTNVTDTGKDTKAHKRGA